jgi:hypothetical protein
MPYRSYIDVFDFPNPESLANFLKRVGRNRDEYNSYFEWKNNYCVREMNSTYFCDLCKKLNEPSVNKYYSESQLNDWWFKKAQCYQYIPSNHSYKRVSLL